MLYAFALAPLGRAAWLGAFLFAICGALRLARFNVYAGVTDRRYFVGLPIPAAAGIGASGGLLLGDDEIPRRLGAVIAAGASLGALFLVGAIPQYILHESVLARTPSCPWPD